MPRAQQTIEKRKVEYTLQLFIAAYYHHVPLISKHLANDILQVLMCGCVPTSGFSYYSSIGSHFVTSRCCYPQRLAAMRSARGYAPMCDSFVLSNCLVPHCIGTTKTGSGFYSCGGAELKISVNSNKPAEHKLRKIEVGTSHAKSPESTLS